MTISKIKQIIPIAMQQIESIAISTVTINGHDYRKISNILLFKKGLALISDLAIFNDLVDSFKTSTFFELDVDSVTILPVEADMFYSNFTEIVHTLDTVKKILDRVVDDPKENTIFIKIVDPADLESLKKNIEPFQKILSNTILHQDIGGEIIFGGVEPGSTWIKVFVRSKTAILLIGGLMWSAAVVSKKIQENRILEQIIRSKEIENAKSESLLEANKFFLDLLVDAEANHLYKEFYSKGNVDNEQIERIKLSIKLLSEEISKGAEINPSLLEPEEVTNLFPNLKNLPSIESRIKRIENN